MSDWIDVAPQAEIAPGAWRSVELDGAQVAVFNLGGEYYAIEDVCTHDGGILTGGALEGEEIVCPRHGATPGRMPPPRPTGRPEASLIGMMILPRNLSITPPRFEAEASPLAISSSLVKPRPMSRRGRASHVLGG